MKKVPTLKQLELLGCRSREGAWIEKLASCLLRTGCNVAPVRERGLKIASFAFICLRFTGRSREGAWIEKTSRKLFANTLRRSLP